jgi:creatinine amidohydrolase
MTLRRLWQEMTTAEFAALDAPRVIAILPVGAIEQHGPHLPVEVDARINAGILERVLEIVPDELPVTLLPAMPVGKSNEHIAFPGTLSLSAETLIRLWTEIGESVARAGVRKMVIFNSHGGQPQIADIVARDLRVRFAMLVVTVNGYSLGKPQGLFPESELRHGIHGGTVETSMMLHLRPDLRKSRQFRRKQMLLDYAATLTGSNLTLSKVSSCQAMTCSGMFFIMKLRSETTCGLRH